MDSLEISGKTVEEATSAALKELRAELDEVDITVLDAGTKGFFGFGAKSARVLVTVRFDPERKARQFLREVTAAMRLPMTVTTQIKDRQMFVNMQGEDMGVLIGKRGQTLDSLQYLVNLVVNKGTAPYISVTLDTENYRARRKETLESLAINLAKKVRATRRNAVLEPMNPYERRIIHSALQNNRYVATYSEGDEPFRNVVIAPK